MRIVAANTAVLMTCPTLSLPDPKLAKDAAMLVITRLDERIDHLGGCDERPLASRARNRYGCAP
jgi:hypothetical protein